MKTNLLEINGSIVSEIDLPKIFEIPYRPDLIHKAYVSLKTHELQPKGTDPTGSEKTSAQSWNTGRGVSRVARVKGSGTGRANKAGGVASVVGGRIAHPPRSEKNIHKSINQKERKLALASAIAATSNKELVSLRGHKVDGVKSFPILIVDNIENINKTKDLLNVLTSLNLLDDVNRVLFNRKTRSGTSRIRGRTIRTGIGPLIVVADDKGICKAASNIPGVDCVLVKNLTVLDLAPGSHPIRLVIWSKSAIDRLPKPLLGIGEVIGS